MNSILNNASTMIASAAIGLGPLVLAQVTTGDWVGVFKEYGVPVGIIVLLVLLLRDQGQTFAKALADKGTEFAGAIATQQAAAEKRIDAIYQSHIAKTEEFGRQMAGALENERKQSERVYTDLFGLLRDREEKQS